MKKVAIVGTISNSEKCLEADLHRVIGAFSDFTIVRIFLVESDSSDSTVELLRRLKFEVPNFDYVSLGNLRNEIPERITRIRYCRNFYVDYLRKLVESAAIDYVAVADLDGMNSKISSHAIRTSFSRDDWGVVLANQKRGYYDLLALREKSWCPGDVMIELRNLQSSIDQTPLPRLALLKRLKRRIEFDNARKIAIYSKMKVIPPGYSWIQVQSGFGGLGIYKAELFSKFDYREENDFDYIECEHVALCRKITQSGEKIFINPEMINNNFNTYNINRFLLIRQLRGIYWNLKKAQSAQVIS